MNGDSNLGGRNSGIDREEEHAERLRSVDGSSDKHIWPTDVQVPRIGGWEIISSTAACEQSHDATKR